MSLSSPRAHPGLGLPAGAALAALLLPVVLVARIALLTLVLPALGLDGLESTSSPQRFLLWPWYGLGLGAALHGAVLVACGGLLAHVATGFLGRLSLEAAQREWPRAVRASVAVATLALLPGSLALAWGDGFAASVGVVRANLSIQSHELGLDEDETEWLSPLLEARDQALHPEHWVLRYEDGSELQADFGRLPGAVRWGRWMAALFLGLVPGALAGWGAAGLTFRLTRGDRR